MKKTIVVISREEKSINREQTSIHGYNLVLSNSPSIVDLPSRIANLLIDNDKITFRAISWCMFPVIWAGDIVKVEQLKQENIKIGDILLYKSLGRAYAHRLVKKYQKRGKLYIITSGEEEYRSNKFDNCGGVLADNILGKVVEVKRGKLSFKPDDIYRNRENAFSNRVKLSLGNLMLGRLKMWLWILTHKAKQYIAKIFIRLQEFRLYRYFFRKLLKNRISFFVGTPVAGNKREVNNLCFYRKFDDFLNDLEEVKGLYNISARINNKPVGNISLFFERINNRRICELSNFMVRIPYRGGGIGRRSTERILFLCNKVNTDEIKVVLSKEDKIASGLFKKSGFRA